MSNVAPVAGEEIVGTQYVIATSDQPVTEVGPQEAGSASNKWPIHDFFIAMMF